MGLTTGEIAFWGLVALWMTLAFLAWGLAYGTTGRKAGRNDVGVLRLRSAQVLGCVVLAISIVLFIPFFASSEDFISPSIITVTNASVALFVAVGILMVSRERPAMDTPGGPGAGSGYGLSDEGGITPVGIITGEPEVTAGGPDPAYGMGPSPKPRSIDCPQCSRSFEVTIRSLPVAIKCPHCGVEGELEA